MSEPLLKTCHLKKSFGGVTAVCDFSISILPGQVHGIIGPNGAGKTTIFNILSRIYVQDAGTIEFLGKNLDGASQIDVALMGLSRTFQNTRLFPGLSVLDNVKVAIDYSGKYSLFEAMFRLPRVRREERAITSRAEACLEMLKLDKYASARPASLSYGLQRRVEIARALANAPKLLMLDEPAAGLNPEEVFELIDFIQHIKQSYTGISVLVIEHRMDLIMNLCDHICVQDFGNTIADGTPEEIQRDPVVLAAYLGEG